MNGYTHQPEHSAWMREPWTCPKCSKTMGVGGKPAHVRYCGDDLETRFWSKVDKTASPLGCWLWTGALNVDGYGVLGVAKRIRSAHRMAWTYTHGDPGKMCVLHKCDVRNCCNPDHLFLGTKLDNALDKAAKGRSLKGSKNRNAKLTETQAREILALKGSISSSELCKRYGVGVGVIQAIWRGDLWKHIQTPANR